jgi:hypothetical protein
MTTPAQPTREPDRLDTPPFTIEAGAITRQGGSSSRTVLAFAAPAARQLDGGLDVNVHAVLFDAQGRFIGRRAGDRSRTVVGNRAQWSHEIDNDWLAQAARITYELEYRFDHRRKILGGELPPLPAEAAGSDYYRWLNLDPRSLEDRSVRLDFALWVRSSELVITISQQPKYATDACRTEFELDLVDADHQLAYTRSFSTGLNLGQPSFDDTSISIDRRALRALRFFELRGRTEGRGLARWSFDVPA